jgi:hypothetical protein
MSKSKTVKAWHFTRKTLRDGRPIPPVGEWLKHEGPLVMCESGLHASRRVLDAINYAPCGTIHRVECRGDIEEQSDKLVCRQRRILASISAERADQIFRRFARLVAWTHLDKWDAPEIVRQWLETGDESIRDAARDAAWAAAGDAAWAAAGDAARAAAWAAARDAARDAAWDAARAAARDAAWAAAGAATWDAAWDAARAAARDAARDAAWDAARAAAGDAAGAAARAAYNLELEKLLLAEMGLKR